MPPLVGTVLADRYRIDRELGAGGMATVYLAHDIKHDRRVAVKVLRPELSAIVGAERFLHEIRTTANLQHPHILPLHDSGETNGVIFYVMPFVVGESLRDRLNREKQLPVDDAIRIAHDAAEALDYAHRQGVIHRDIKPENILLHDGRALVADFGIALAVSTAGGATRLTDTGISLGTPHYMSPEQAMGEREITARSDVYSLGCVLYEMLSGEPPFTGPTAQAIIAKVVTSEPTDVRTLRKTVPLQVAAAVHIALQRLPADRFHSASDLAEAISGQHSLRLLEVPHRRVVWVNAGWRTLLPWGLLAASLVVAAIGWTRRPETLEAPPVLRFVVADSSLHRSVAGRNVTLSPDASKLVYRRGQGNRAVFVMRDLVSLEELEVDGPGSVVAFSPDSRSFVTHTDGIIRTRKLSGGVAVDIAQGNRPSWGDAGRIVFERDGGLFTVAANGGDERRLTNVDYARGERRHQWAQFLPGGESVVFSVVDTIVGNDELAVVRVADGRVTRLGIRGTSAQFVPGDYLVFARFDGTGGAVAFDPRRLEVSGPEIHAIDQLIVRSGGAAEFSVARNGVVAFIEGTNVQQLVLVGMDGLAKPLSDIRTGYTRPQVSPDGSRVLVTVSSDLWILDIASGSERRLTTDRRSSNAWWTENGRSILWQRHDTNHLEIRTERLDGSSPARTLFTMPRSEFRFGAIVPDPLGQQLIAVRGDRTGQFDLLVASLDTVPLVFRPLIASSANEHSPVVSPDGRRLAYSSNETGRNEVYVTTFPTPGATVRISTGGGDNAAWSPDGRTLFYRGGNRMIAIRFTPSGFTTDSLFSLDNYPQVPGPPSSTLAMTPDGKHFLMAVADQSRRLIVALSFAEEIRRRFAALQQSQ